MTENEAWEILKISTQMRKHLPNLAEVYDIAVKVFEEVERCRAIGTVEELQTLKEYDTPKRPKKQKNLLLIREGWEYACPSCGCGVGINSNDRVDTFATNWSVLCSDVANRLEELLEYKHMYEDLCK